MPEHPPEDLTPPGPPIEPASEEPGPIASTAPATGGVSVDDWLAARQAQSAAPANPHVAASTDVAASPNPYFAAPPIADQPTWREFDRASLASFLLALTWIGAPIAAILGFKGLRRTADGTRAGRWAAILGVVLGLLGMLGLVAGVAGAMWFRDNIKSVGRVEAGECVNIDDADGVSFNITDCDERHQAEVVAAGDLDSSTYPIFLRERAADFCSGLLDEHYQRAARTGRYLVTVVIGAPDPDRARVGDAFACYFESADGRSLTEAIDVTEQGNV